MQQLVPIPGVLRDGSGYRYPEHMMAEVVSCYLPWSWLATRNGVHERDGSGHGSWESFVGGGQQWLLQPLFTR